MDRFQHMMRTTQHTKSVEMIMTRTHNNFFSSKSPHKKPTSQGDNITTYLRKFEIDRENLNLAKRIMQCESQHSRNKYIKEWENIKRFLRVRSNFKKTLHAKEPKIYRYQPILGKGKLRVDIQIMDIEAPHSHFSRKNVYKFSFVLGRNQIQPDKKLITIDLIKNYSTSFYAPLFLSKKKIQCKIFQIHENNYYQSGSFDIDLSLPGYQEASIISKCGKIIGKIMLNLNIQGGKNRLFKKSAKDKQNNPSVSVYKLPFIKQECSSFKQARMTKQKDWKDGKEVLFSKTEEQSLKTNYCSEAQC